MKNTMKLPIGIAALIAVAPGLFSSAQAKDGVSASPKLQQQMNEQKAPKMNVQYATSASWCGGCGVNDAVTSPRLKQQMTENKATSCAPRSKETVSTTARPNDGVSASPKLRAQLQDQSAQFEIAPVK